MKKNIFLWEKFSIPKTFYEVSIEFWIYVFIRWHDGSHNMIYYPSIVNKIKHWHLFLIHLMIYMEKEMKLTEGWIFKGTLKRYNEYLMCVELMWRCNFVSAFVRCPFFFDLILWNRQFWKISNTTGTRLGRNTDSQNLCSELLQHKRLKYNYPFCHIKINTSVICCMCRCSKI